MARTTSMLFAALAAAACSSPPTGTGEPVVPREPVVIRAGKPVASLPGERFFKNVRQITFGGENAEAYWSADGRKLILQSRRGTYAEGKFDCDQIFVIDLETGAQKLVSTGKGRTTCSYFLQGDKRILYASTHLADPECPQDPPRGPKYLWAIYPGFDIFTANPDGTDLVRITDAPGYDAEGTICPVTGRIVFTSVRDGDLELYSMEPDGSDVVRLTNRPGYDGGAFYSHDGTKLVQRSGFLKTDAEKQEYFDLLKQNLVAPSQMEITVIDRDGTDFRQVTDNGKANFAPFWHPDNKRILFSSNLGDTGERRGQPNFDIYMVNEDGSGLVQVTYCPSFDGFPMFSPDGEYLAFASNRQGKERGETNVFIAEWVEAEGEGE